MNLSTLSSFISFFISSPKEALERFNRLELLLEEMIMNQAEMKAVVDAAKDEVVKVSAQLDKVIGEVDQLNLNLANTNNILSPDVEASVLSLSNAVADLKVKSQELDDKNPDAPVVAATIDAAAAVDAANDKAENAVVEVSTDPAPIVDLSGSSPS